MDFTTIGLFAVMGVLIFFMFRNSRKRKRMQEELQSKIQTGAEIMTNFGLFGTLVSVDTVTNVAEVETSPGVIVRVHRQTITRVVDPEADSDAPRSVEEAMERANKEAAAREAELNVDHAIPAGEPEFGERVAPSESKPARRTSKKAAE
jgi:preprotein translocase subunit YajC